MSTLMVSVSGIRGIVGNGLAPDVISKYSSAYADLIQKGKIILGTDGRISGNMVKHIVIGTLLAKGLDVIDIGIVPTPTVLFNIKNLKASGGIQISASHNPNEWNALKLMNQNGEFLSPEENKIMLSKLESASTNYSAWNKLGKYEFYKNGLNDHIKAVLKTPFTDVKKIRKRKFKVLLDCVNGAGSYSMPKFLEKLGCDVIKINCDKTGIFPRLPEPIPSNLKSTMKAVKESGAEIGIVVDPDVDRLVLITEQGQPFSEENTIAQAVKFYLSKQKGSVVANLSTTRAVEDITNELGGTFYHSPVGEANVVKKMKEVKAIIGGEGSGGVILPAVNFGRDALVGTIIMLQHLLEFNGTMSQLKNSLPKYFIVKNKIELGEKNPDFIIGRLIEKYKNERINTEDGLRIDFENHWVQFRKSNTEPIVRCMVEAKSLRLALSLSKKYLEEIKSI